MDKSGTIYRTLSFPDYFKCKAEEMPLRVYVAYEMAGAMPDLINIVFIKRM